MHRHTYELTMENKGDVNGVDYRAVNSAPILTTTVMADNQEQAIKRAEWRNPTHKVKSCVMLN